MNSVNCESSLYERIGGANAVASLVERFYTRVFADADLRPYFDNAGLDQLERMQVEFFSAALGGPSAYSGRAVIHAHHGRGIKRVHFQAFVEHLFASLTSYPLTNDECYAIISRLNTCVDDVVDCGTGPVDD